MATNLALRPIRRWLTTSVGARAVGLLILAALEALAAWVVAVPLFGVVLTVSFGPDMIQRVTPPSIAIVALGAGLIGWGVLGFLNRLSASGRTAWTVLAVVVLAFSVLGPLSAGATDVVKGVLIVMHMAVGLTLILGLPRALQTRAR